jgi:hypothetical protein
MYPIGHKKTIVTEQLVSRRLDEIRKEDFHPSPCFKIYDVYNVFHGRNSFIMLTGDRISYLLIIHSKKNQPVSICSPLPDLNHITGID